jgi:preprotein translocase subunit SecE
VARDRQRAKQRRRRQPGGGGGANPASPRTRAREADQDVTPEPTDTVFPQRGAVEPVEVPEDEVGAPLDAEAESAPVEDEAVIEERRERREPRQQRAGIITFLGHVVDELGRVQWPDRRHVGQGTAVVLGFVVIAGSYLVLLDAIWKPLIEAIL